MDEQSEMLKQASGYLESEIAGVRQSGQDLNNSLNEFKITVEQGFDDILSRMKEQQ